MEEKTKIIRIQAGMSDLKGILIPRGVQEQITIEIADEVATYYFKDSRVTKKFALIEIEGDKVKGKPQTTLFIERVGKAVKRYPDKGKEEIRDEILEELKKLNAKIKTKDE